MRDLVLTIIAASLGVFAVGGKCCGDTFTHRSGEVLHGYSTGIEDSGKTVVNTAERGVIELDLSQWQVSRNRLGRDNKIFVITLDAKIMLEIQTEALIEALDRAAAQGPLFILVQIDTPGGRVDYTRRICGAIMQIRHCDIYAFVEGGHYGGAISGGAAVAFACDKIYMVATSSIGAASTIAVSAQGPKDFEDLYGEAVAEKINSAWRSYLASLAEQNQRPGLLAGAMVDKDLEVIEVQEDHKRLFIDPINKTQQQQLVHTWSTKGSLLTLTGEQAVACGIADKVVQSQRELLRQLQAEQAQLVVDESFQKAGRLFVKAQNRFDKVTRSLDLKIKQFKRAQTHLRSLKMLRDISEDYKSLIALAKRFPDLKVDVAVLEQQMNSVEALYQESKGPR